MDDAFGALRSYEQVVHHAVAPATSKEVMLRAYKMGRHEADHRGRADVDFAALMQLEQAQRARAKRGPGKQ